LQKGWIYEVLMETGGLHRAPMGLWTEGGDKFTVDVYRDSSTFNNLNSTGIGTIYFIEDPKYFIETKDVDYFAKADFKVIEKLEGNPTRFVCKVLRLDVVRKGKALNRAQGLFLEWLIDRSRKRVDNTARKRAKYYKRKIKKVAPGSVYDQFVRNKRWKK
jgi:hypothetical protein